MPFCAGVHVATVQQVGVSGIPRGCQYWSPVFAHEQTTLSANGVAGTFSDVASNRHIYWTEMFRGHTLGQGLKHVVDESNGDAPLNNVCTILRAWEFRTASREDFCGRAEQGL